MSLWKRFTERYPNADLSKFKTQPFFGKQTIMFTGKDENISVFCGHNFRTSIYFSDEIKRALGRCGPCEIKSNFNFLLADSVSRSLSATNLFYSVESDKKYQNWSKRFDFT